MKILDKIRRSTAEKQLIQQQTRMTPNTAPLPYHPPAPHVDSDSDRPISVHQMNMRVDEYRASRFRDQIDATINAPAPVALKRLDRRDQRDLKQFSRWLDQLTADNFK